MIPQRILTFDGSELGEFDFREVVKWLRPVDAYQTKLPVMMTVLNIYGHTYLVYLKRNHLNNSDQAVLDEIKPLFGLVKMGCHRIRIRGVPKKTIKEHPWVYPNGPLNMTLADMWSSYYIFRSEVQTGFKDKPLFVCYGNLENTAWMPESQKFITDFHRKFFLEVQKILIYRELFRITDTSLSNILIKYNPYRPHFGPVPMSVDEMKIRDFNKQPKGLTMTAEQFFFSRSNVKGYILASSLGMDYRNYTNKIRLLRESILEVINRVSPDHLWLADYISNRVTNQMELYFRMEYGQIPFLEPDEY